MKTRLFTLAVILLTGSLLSNVSAQERIKAVFKKCETIESVEMNIVKEKVDGKLEEKVVTVIIKDNEALVNEFLAAFKADENNADEVVERKTNGKIVPSFCRFGNVSFSMNINDKNGFATVSLIKESGSKNLKELRDAERAKDIRIKKD